MITTFTQNGPKVGEFFQQASKWIPLYYYDTSSWLVFVRFLEEIEDISKLTVLLWVSFCKSAQFFQMSQHSNCCLNLTKDSNLS